MINFGGSGRSRPGIVSSGNQDRTPGQQSRGVGMASRHHATCRDEFAGSSAINLSNRITYTACQLAAGDQNGAFRKKRGGGEFVGRSGVPDRSEFSSHRIIYFSV